MNASKSERRLRWGLVALVVALGVACAAEDGADIGAVDAQDGGGPPIDVGGDIDGEPPDAGPCALPFDGICLEDRDARCDLVRPLVADGACRDDDGDCFPAGCDDPRYTPIADCDDADAASNRLGEQLCNGRDGDCDGQLDEGYSGLDLDCDACGALGKLECAVDDPTRLACSTAPGQSAAPPRPDEVCDAADDDCDGIVDEGCRLPDRLGAPSEPAICPDGRIAFVEDGGLVVATPTADGLIVDALRPADAQVARPACGPLGLAWLELGPGGCQTPDGGPERCEAELWVALGAEPPRVWAPLGALGRPAVGDEAVYWHTVPGDNPFILGRGPGEDAARQLFPEAASDPTPPREGRMLVRTWASGAPAVVLAQLGDAPGARFGVIDAPASMLGLPGPPVRSGGWMAWAIEGERAAVWVVPAGTGRPNGFFAASRPGPQRAPRLAGDRLAWIDEGTRPPTVRLLDLGTGTERAIATGEIDPHGLALAAGLLVWIDRATDDLYLRRLTPIGE